MEIMDQEIYRSLDTHFGIIGFNEELTISYFNQKAADLINKPASSIVGSQLTDTQLPVYICGKSSAFFQQVMDGQEVWETVPSTDDHSSLLQLHFLPAVSDSKEKKKGLITISLVSSGNVYPTPDEEALYDKNPDFSAAFYTVVDTDGIIHLYHQEGEELNRHQHIKELLPASLYERYLQNIRDASHKNKLIVTHTPDPTGFREGQLLHYFPIRNESDKPLVGIIATDVPETRQKENRIRQINQLLEKLIELSDQLFRERAESTHADHLTDLLEVLGEICSAESVLLFRKEAQKKAFQLISQYNQPDAVGLLSEIFKSQQNSPGWIQNQLTQESPFLIAHPDEMPAEAKREREILQKCGIDSLLVTRISTREETTGYLCFINLKEKPKRLGEIIKTIEIASYQMGIFFRSYQMSRQLENSQRRYQLLTGNISDVVSLQSLSGRCLFVSPSIKKILGYEPEEFIGRLCLTYVHPEDRPAYLHAYNEAKEGKDMVCRHRRKHKDGHFLWVETSGKLVREAEDSFVLIVTRDISKQKKAEDELKQREEYFKSLIHSQSNYLIRTDLEGNFTYANPAFLEQYKSFGEIMGMFSLDTIHPDDHEKTYRMVEVCLSEPGKVVPIEIKKRLPDQEGMTNFWEFVAIADEQGNPTEVQGVGYDITEKKNALQKIEKSEAFMRSLINNNSNPIWAVDNNDRLLYANEVFHSMSRNLLGISFQKGDYFFELLPEAEREHWKNYYKRAQQNSNFKDQQKFMYKGKDYYFDIYFSPIINEKGENIGHSVFAANVSDLKETELQLLSAKKSLEEAIKTRSTFLSMITHELRTPLNAILGMSNLVRATRLSKKQSQYIDTLSYSGKMLNSLINDILDYTSLQAGEFRMEVVNFNLLRVVEQTVNLYQSMAIEKNITLRYIYDKTLPQYIKGDPTRLGQIFNNLVENAIKFTESGEVGIEVSEDDSKARQKCLLIKVSDTGIGIPQHKQQEIFEPFRQADNETDSYQGGRGLGLAIVTQLVEHNKGSIAVESQVGRGTTFTVRYPYEEADIQDSGSARQVQHEWLSKLRVLYIEDMTINQTLMKGLFQNWGSQLDIASDGYQGIELIEQNDYDLILIDLLMPKMDGYETARRIRALKQSGIRNLPIIAVSAFQGKEMISQIHDAGINDHISKPIDFDKLQNLILRYTQYGEEKEVPEVKGNRNENYLSRLERLAFKDRDQYNNFLKNLQNEFASSRQRLEEAVRKGDNEMIAFVRHHNYALLSMFSGKHEQLLERLRNLKVNNPQDPKALTLLSEIKYVKQEEDREAAVA